MQRPFSLQRVRGFTLIELMITVAVVAILAAVAIPSYADHVRKSRRAQAKADMVEVAQQLERYHTVQNTYVGFALPFAQSPRDGTARYTLGLGNQSASAFTLTVTPDAAQSKDKCGTMTLDQAGRKTPNNTSVAGCW
jgi:type IV pilus assembly protein PilE